MYVRRNQDKEKMEAFNYQRTTTAWYRIILILSVNILISSESFLRSHYDICEVNMNVTECARLFKKLEDALLQDEVNKFQMRRVFFHSPTADPVLLRVIYNVTYAENITKATKENKLHRCGYTSTENQYCSMEKGNMAGDNLENSVTTVQTKCENKAENHNIFISESLQNLTNELKQGNYTYGWTSTGVYTVFHPMILHMTQVQAPFVALKIVHNHILQDQRSLEANTFLWDGSSSDLPTLRLNLHITDLTCIPTQDVFKTMLSEINTLLNVYAAQVGTLQFEMNTKFIGFTLPETSLTATAIRYDDVRGIFLWYNGVLLASYFITLITFYIWYNKCDLNNVPDPYRERQIKAIHMWMERNEILIFGILITAATASMCDAFAKIVNFYWMYTNDQFSVLVTIILWLPHGCLLIYGLDILLIRILDCYNNKSCNDFSHGYILLSLHFFTFSLLYFLFPAIVLVLAYPTQMLATMVFALAYLFSTTILAAILIQAFRPKKFKLRRETQTEEKQTKTKSYAIKTILSYAFILIAYSALLLSALYIGLLMLYALLIGKGSAINTGPLFVISLLPSILMSSVALKVQMIVFNGKLRPNGQIATLQTLRRASY